MRILCIALMSTATLCCARVEAARRPVDVEMRNVDLHVTADVTLHVTHLRGRFEAAGQHDVPYLDDQTSYAVDVDSAVVAIDLASLNAILHRALGGDRSNVERLSVSIDDEGRLRQKGVIDKAINVPFNVAATLEAMPDGRLRVHTQSVKGFGVPMKALMKVFRFEMDDLLRVKTGHGVVVDGNDLLLDPATLLPPPTIRGRITAARIDRNAVVQTFGDGRPHRLSPPAESRNYIYWRGGTLAFGKLTMAATDLQLIDMDPKDPFDFSVERWNEQLVAGYSKSTPARGLKAHVPDYDDLAKRRR